MQVERALTAVSWRFTGSEIVFDIFHNVQDRLLYSLNSVKIAKFWFASLILGQIVRSVRHLGGKVDLAEQALPSLTLARPLSRINLLVDIPVLPHRTKSLCP